MAKKPSRPTSKRSTSNARVAAKKTTSAGNSNRQVKTSVAANAASKQVKTNRPRRVKLGSYRSLRLQKRITHPVRLPSVWYITKHTALTLWQHKKLFVLLTLLYGFLNIILVRGIAGGTDVSGLKGQLDQLINGHFSALVSGLGIFVLLVSASGNNTSQTAGSYQLFLGLLVSLAVIWSLRQILTGANVRVRDAYYRGMYPLVPFILVLLVCALQTLPLIIGAALYGQVITSGIAVYAVEKLAWALLFGLLGLLSMYMLSSSLFAVYIVTLPDMTPLKALRSARELVRFRRWTVMRKILWLPLLLLVSAAVIMVPIIIVLTALAQWVFFLLTMFSLVALHAYMYTLYRELLNE